MNIGQTGYYSTIHGLLRDFRFRHFIYISFVRLLKEHILILKQVSTWLNQALSALFQQYVRRRKMNLPLLLWSKMETVTRDTVLWGLLLEILRTLHVIILLVKWKCDHVAHNKNGLWLICLLNYSQQQHLCLGQLQPLGQEYRYSGQQFISSWCFEIF